MLSSSTKDLAIFCVLSIPLSLLTTICGTLTYDLGSTDRIEHTTMTNAIGSVPVSLLIFTTGCLIKHCAQNPEQDRDPSIFTVDSFVRALTIQPDRLQIFLNIGFCFFGSTLFSAAGQAAVHEGLGYTNDLGWLDMILMSCIGFAEIAALVLVLYWKRDILIEAYVSYRSCTMFKGTDEDNAPYRHMGDTENPLSPSVARIDAGPTGKTPGTGQRPPLT